MPNFSTDLIEFFFNRHLVLGNILNMSEFWVVYQTYVKTSISANFITNFIIESLALEGFW
jgi:hypothetical protein